MSAVATKPRKSEAKLPGASAPLVYRRPEQVYAASTSTSADERLSNLRAAFHKADALLEAAYDATPPGSAIDTLLDHINHALSMCVMSPILRNEDEAHLPVTKADAEASYNAAFKMLAALEGAMALSLGEVIYPTLVEAFNLLDWAQTECDSAALGALLPADGAGAKRVSDDSREYRLAAQDALAEAICARYGHALAVVRVLCHEHQKSPLVRVAHNLMRHDSEQLSRALSLGELGSNVDALNEASADLSVVLELLAAAAADLSSDGEDSAMWGAHGLAELAKKALDDHIQKIEFPGSAS